MPILLIKAINNHSYIAIVILISLYPIFFFIIRKDFLKPITNLRKWAKNYQQTHPENDIPKQTSLFSPVIDAITSLNDENQIIYDNMEEIVQKQIQRLSNKTSSLEVLYQITSLLNKTNNIDDLITSLLKTIINITNANAGCVRLLNNNGELYIINSLGDIDTKTQQQTILTSDCICGDIATANEPFVQFSIHTCAKCVGEKCVNNSDIGSIFLPIRYQNKTLGIFNLFFNVEPILDENMRALLNSIVNHIAIALDKSRLDTEQQRTNLIQERISLSHEIHDSLAQTIVSLNLQISTLINFIKNKQQDNTLKKTDEIQNTIKQINDELRSLMYNFREGLDKDGLIPSIQNLVNNFKQETKINVFFQAKVYLQISPKVELQIFRIIQEALTNIKKHANAKNVRILFSKINHKNHLLIEDDGIGIKQKNKSKTAKHIGLKVMKERAVKINAEFTIESDNEGTRILLIF
ncbi:Two component sensor histidine kinase [hydrothermal vent metagenome]|uniref:histidine kinase n=1 Tax=hydrothermal vent metagenome TaxID=652676 RepID=A0A1W1CJ32_9ZZZZ